MDEARPEFIRPVTDEARPVVQRPLGLWERLWGHDWLRKTAVFLCLALLWQLYGLWLHNSLLFPSFTETVAAFWAALLSGELVLRALHSLRTLLIGYGIGILLAALLTGAAISSRLATDFLEGLTSMFNPLPAIAILPLALTWFGLGEGSIIFVLVHSVLWAVALNTHAGFRAVSPTLRMVGRNYGLGGVGYVTRILMPAAFPSILAGLKIGWAFAWRTLIAAELVFGVTSGSGGLGWFIYESKNALEIPSVFAGLFMVILIGILVENVIFRSLEQRTIGRWGMQI
jgi:NitT/TauT family transport system permease protein